jgi:hypothetical protein
MARLPDSASRFSITNISANSKPKSNGSKRSVKNLCQTGLCKNSRKSASLPCPFNKFMPILVFRIFRKIYVTQDSRANKRDSLNKFADFAFAKTEVLECIAYHKNGHNCITFEKKFRDDTNFCIFIKFETYIFVSTLEVGVK